MYLKSQLLTNSTGSLVSPHASSRTSHPIRATLPCSPTRVRTYVMCVCVLSTVPARRGQTMLSASHSHIPTFPPEGGELGACPTPHREPGGRATPCTQH